MHRTLGRYALDPATKALAQFIGITLNTSHAGGQRASVNKNVSGNHGPDTAPLARLWTFDFD
jgi:hypothetical protein